MRLQQLQQHIVGSPLSVQCVGLVQRQQIVGSESLKSMLVVCLKVLPPVLNAVVS